MVAYATVPDMSFKVANRDAADRLRASDVFTPNSFPQHTYVAREGQTAERRTREALETPNCVISVSGPSKSGKSVLIRKVVGDKNLIKVNGSEIRDIDDFWDRILERCNIPETTTDTTTNVESEQNTSTIGGSAGLPGTGISGNKTTQRNKNVGSARSVVRNRGGLLQVEQQLSGSKKVIFIDDFHYIEALLRKDIAKQIKAVAEAGIRIIVASVPHRSDDVVRSNHELRGRTTNIDIKFWSRQELMKIAWVGFPKLNIDISRSDDSFATEACWSPQLMQRLCLEACTIAGYHEAQERLAMMSLREGKFKRLVLEQAAESSDYSTVVEQLHQGAKIRGTARIKFRFKDDSTGDVYRAILLALKEDPPLMTLEYSDLMSRIQSACVGVYPNWGSVLKACKRIADISQASEQYILDWEADTSRLSIVDPYFLFYLRSSVKLAELASK